MNRFGTNANNQISFKERGDAIINLPANERIQIIDIIRGIAILGILFVNMSFYSSSLMAISLQVELWQGFWNKSAELFRNILIDGKFINIFSFLFGFGMILFKEGAIAKGRRFIPLFSRRLIALFLFGLIHGWFIWYGDILLHYAVLGFFLLLFHKCKPRTLLIWSILLLSLLPIVILMSGNAGMPASSDLSRMGQEAMKHDTAIYGSGSFIAIQNQRFIDWNSTLINQILFYPRILGMFLLGSYFAKRKILHNISGHLRLVKNICKCTGLFGFGLIMLGVFTQYSSNPVIAGWHDFLFVLGMLVGSPLLALFYITFFALLFQKENWKRRLLPFSFVGKMAFTNYIAQSVICTLIFYSYGLGLYGKVGTFAGLWLALGIYILQLIVSRLWLQKYQMGLLEWIWRILTYLRVSPLKYPNKHNR